MNLTEAIDKAVNNIARAEDLLLFEAINNYLINNKLTRDDVVIIEPRDRHNGKFYVMRKSDAKAHVGEKEDLSKAYYLGRFTFDPDKGEHIWMKEGRKEMK